MTPQPFHPGDRVLTPRGVGTIKRLTKNGEFIVQGDEWMFYGTFTPQQLQLIEQEVQAA